MTKSLGQFLHDTAGKLGGWERKWNDMSERQQSVWDIAAKRLIDKFKKRECKFPNELDAARSPAEWEDKFTSDEMCKPSERPGSITIDGFTFTDQEIGDATFHLTTIDGIVKLDINRKGS